MALIILRADTWDKILNALADIERHAGLKITGKPRIMRGEDADRIASSILKGGLRRKSSVAAAVEVAEDDTKSIMSVMKIHPPAHLIVVSSEYGEYRELKDNFKKMKVLKGYYSHKG